eukprot:4384224-Prymnesium_polylepis.1
MRHCGGYQGWRGSAADEHGTGPSASPAPRRPGGDARPRTFHLSPHAAHAFRFLQNLDDRVSETQTGGRTRAATGRGAGRWVHVSTLPPARP